MKEFTPFRVDTDNECLWRNNERIQLTPKTFALLAYLLERSGTLESSPKSSVESHSSGVLVLVLVG